MALTYNCIQSLSLQVFLIGLVYMVGLTKWDVCEDSEMHEELKIYNYN